MSRYLFLWILVSVMSAASCGEEQMPAPATGGVTDTLPPERLSYLALGDSYTIGQSVDYQERWPVQLAARLRAELPDMFYMENPGFIARTGWTTGNLLQAIASADTLKPAYDLVSLLIGVNNQYQNQPENIYPVEFSALLEQAIAFAGYDTSRVIVLSIPDYAYTPFGQGRPNPILISQQIDQYNAVNRQIAESYGVAYFNITPVSRQGLAQPGLVASDGLHPSGDMYALWVEEIWEYVAGVLK